jgi:hypothetical protein
MRLFRQEHLGDWRGLFERVAEELRRFATGARLLAITSG